ncbi:hypothetical protein FB451DRAFT_152684 [Mycena latifolia]|nr:hypothetical protein FB451DRAFT_152684 [Mycena latifolia]
MSLEQPTATADDWKNQGNSFFKSGNATEYALTSFQVLCESGGNLPTNPVYPSNLSAALFEEGDCLSCVTNIDRWRKLHGSKKPPSSGENTATPDPDPSIDHNKALALRLSGRLAKALSHGVRSGSVSQKQM